jgi:phosphatidylglycerophosphate synthase
LLRESRLGKRYLEWIDKVPVPVLQKLSLRPVHVSFIGVLVGLLTIPAYAYTLWLGGVMVLLSGFFDSLDGGLARKSMQINRSGSYIDSTLDRYSDYFYLIGVWVYFIFSSPSNLIPVTLLIFLCLSGAYQVSYSRARGEGSGLSVTIGFFGRAERVLILGVGSILVGLLQSEQVRFVSNILLASILLLLGLGSHITAWQRMAHLYRSLLNRY